MNFDPVEQPDPRDPGPETFDERVAWAQRRAAQRHAAQIKEASEAELDAPPLAMLPKQEHEFLGVGDVGFDAPPLDDPAVRRQRNLLAEREQPPAAPAVQAGEQGALQQILQEMQRQTKVLEQILEKTGGATYQ